MALNASRCDRQSLQASIAENQFLAADLEESIRLREAAKKEQFKAKIVWRNVFLFLLLHLGALSGLYHLIFTAKWATIGWSLFLWVAGGVGITAGAHRLWSHKSYKASLPLRLLLIVMNCVAFQNDVIEWARDHRCHHKWTDTDADPHNVNRGFFFSHMGWLLVKKHPQVKAKGSTLDMSDLSSDPVLAFQRKFYLPLVLLFCFLLPTLIPVLFWHESSLVALYTASLLRYTFTLHATWMINSAAHVFGYRPYDVSISSAESVWTTLLAVGEGGHNYHHTFPQDYRTSEMNTFFNFTKAFIDLFGKIGWAYDLRTVGEESIERQKARQLGKIRQELKE
uniref:FA_desaturase domain-containing protein n=1 Tax=Globodera pallida TaxID=36090 RepID=A0A183BXT1_GLOPA